MSDFKVNPGTLRKASDGMSEASEDLVSKTEALLGEVGDVSALGTNDTLGGIASALYGAVLERVQETVDSVNEEYGGQSTKLAGAAKAYAAVEEANVQAASVVKI